MELQKSQILCFLVDGLRHAGSNPSAFGPFLRKGKSNYNPGGERRSLFCWSSLYPLWKGILFKWPFFEFPFGRYFVEYSRAHGSLSLDFNLSLRPFILTGRFSLFFSPAGKSFSICRLWPSSLYSNIFRLRFAKIAQKASLISSDLY